MAYDNIPQSHDEYEKAIIALCLSPGFSGNDALTSAVARLKPEYFRNNECADAFRILCDMINGKFGVRVLVPGVVEFADFAAKNDGKYKSFSGKTRDEIFRYTVDITANNNVNPNNADYYISRMIDQYKAFERWRIGEELKKLTADEDAPERQRLRDDLAALEIMGNDRFEKFFTPSTLAATSAALKKRGAGLGTGYTLSKYQNGEPIRTDFTIPPKQLTVIAAATGHGKSTFCYNLALRLIERNKRPDKTDVKVVYISYEESKESIEPKFINVMTGLNLTENNREAIAADIANGGTGEFIVKGYKDAEKQQRERMRKQYQAAIRKFYDYAAAGTLTIQYCDFDTTDLCTLIREYRKRDAADVVIIDYIQLLEKESSKAHGRNRPDELKEICADLRKLANDERFGLPLIITSQFNREVQRSNDPRTMDKTNLGESANIEHSANVILGLWSCQETNPEKYYKTDQGGAVTNELTADGKRLLEYQHTAHIDDPFIYARLLKSRDGVNGLNATLNYYGNCGRIDNTTDTTPNERAGLKRDELTEPHNTLTPSGGSSKPAKRKEPEPNELKSVFGEDAPF